MAAPTSPRGPRSITALKMLPKEDSVASPGAEELSFASCLARDFPKGRQQAWNGVLGVHRLCSLFTKFCSLEEEYAAKMEKLLAKEKKKFEKRCAPHDGMRIFVHQYRAMHDALLNRVHCMTNFTGRLRKEVVGPLTTVETTSTISLQNIDKKEKKASATVRAATDKMVRLKEECEKIIDNAAAAKRREKGIDEEKHKQAAEGNKKSFWTFKNKLSNLTLNSSQELTQKLLHTIPKYQEAITEANEARLAFVNEHVPVWLGELQVIEETRLRATKENLKNLAAVWTQTDAQLTAISGGLSPIVDVLEPKTDIENYLKDHLSEYGPPPPLEMFAYALPFTPDQIQQDGEIETNPLFNSTVADIMALQQMEEDALRKAGKPVNSLKYPEIVEVLINGVRSLNGLQTEGIFRLSAAQQDMQALRLQLLSGENTIKGSDPHVYACMLKDWMRSLLEPIIPYTSYAAALKLVKGNRVHYKKIFNLFGELSEPNRLIIEHITALVREIIRPENSGKNRMTMEALAIVFAPCLMRSPDVENPLAMLSNCQMEAVFVGALFKVLNTNITGPPLVNVDEKRGESDDEEGGEGGGAGAGGGGGGGGGSHKKRQLVSLPSAAGLLSDDDSEVDK